MPWNAGPASRGIMARHGVESATAALITTDGAGGPFGETFNTSLINTPDFGSGLNLQVSAFEFYVGPYLTLGFDLSNNTASGFVTGSPGSGPSHAGDDYAMNMVGTLTPELTTTIPTTAAPEIDPASAASGVTLLLGSLLVLRGRRPAEVGWKKDFA
jgi:hypothetical protein